MRIYWITTDTIGELNTKFVKAASQENYGSYIMKGLCNIEVSINDNWEDDMRYSKTDMFIPAWQPIAYLNYNDKNFTQNSNADRFQIENLTLDMFCECCSNHIKKQIAEGAGVLKIPVAYWRSLYFEDVSYSEANSLFNEVIKTKNLRFWRGLHFF